VVIPYLWAKLVEKIYISCQIVSVIFHWSPFVRCSVLNEPRNKNNVQL